MFIKDAVNTTIAFSPSHVDKPAASDVASGLVSHLKEVPYVPPGPRAPLEETHLCILNSQLI